MKHENNLDVIFQKAHIDNLEKKLDGQSQQTFDEIRDYQKLNQDYKQLHSFKYKFQRVIQYFKYSLSLNTGVV